MSCPLRRVAWPPEAWGELLGPSEPRPSSVVRPALSAGAGARVLGARPAPPALPRIQQNAHLPPSTRPARGPFPGCMFQIHLTFIKGGNNASIGIVTGQSLPVWAESLRRAQRARGLVSRASPRRGRGRGADTHSPAVVRSRGARPTSSRDSAACSVLARFSSAASPLTCLCFRHTLCLEPLPAPRPLFVRGSLLPARSSGWVLGPPPACTVPRAVPFTATLSLPTRPSPILECGRLPPAQPLGFGGGEQVTPPEDT